MSLSEKEIQVMDLEASVKTLKESIHNIESTLEGEAALASTKIEKMSKENEDLRRIKYELESSVKNITVEREHIVVLNEELNVRIVEFEVQVKEMRSQYESLQVEQQKQALVLRERNERAAQDSGALSELQEVLDRERGRADDLQVSLNDSETERESLGKRLQTAEAKADQFDQVDQQNQHLAQEVGELTKKNEFLFGEIAKERVRLEAKLETLAEALEEKKKEYSIKEFEVSQLQSENLQLISYKRQVLTLEQEAREMEAQLVQVTAEARMARPRAKSPSPALSTLSTVSATSDNNHNEGDEGMRMQVEFLNSVIVDMQRKNDDLKTKLELYESAGILDESVDFIFNGVSARAVPPRLFCDICDEFDLHDTEDCPTQASSMIVEEEKSHTKKHSKRGVVREYCDTCEIFGHSTESCTEAESY